MMTILIKLILTKITPVITEIENSFLIALDILFLGICPKAIALTIRDEDWEPALPQLPANNGRMGTNKLSTR